MTTKFYQINGVWNTYQYWHDNYGYTTEPTQSMNFKSSASGTWGTAVNPGYFASPGGYTIDNWSFWSDGIVGWKDIDQLALAGAYPATAIDILLERNGAIANAVYVDDSDEFYYLIDGYLSDGWRTWNEVEADGWQVYEGNPPYYIVVNETTGEVVYSISETEENPSMVFSQVGHIEMPDSDMITVYETGVRTESFYFTTNGRNETQNTDISWKDIPVYFEDGTAPAADTPYDGSSVLAFMDVLGNTKQAQGEGLYVNDGVLRLDAPDTDEGEQWSALVEYIEPAPLVYDSASGTISALSLPTSHSGDYVKVTFDSLRYYVKGTANWLNNTTGAFFGKASTTWYYGTLEWTDESLGDLSSLIQVNPTSSNHLVQQTVFRIIFIETGITGVHPYDTGDSVEISNQITAYSYNDGVHSITFYSTSNWFGYSGTGRIQFRYLDETTTFNGLDAYDLILVNNGALSKATTTDRYDMYNAWGGQISIKSYYPQPPAPSELTAYFTRRGASATSNTQITSGNYGLFDASGAAIPSDASHTYTLVKAYDYAGNEVAVPAGVSVFNNLGVLCLENLSGSSITAYRLTYTASDNT